MNKTKKIKEKILEELENKPKIYINPPPQDGCCESCGRSVKDLKPFGKAGDPLVGDFDGQLLVKTFRTMAPNQKEFDINDCLGNEGYLDENKFVKKYGKKNLDRFYFLDQVSNTVSASWECRDCIVLDDKDYFKPTEEKRKLNNSK